jgi:ectoine hydroxylase-related dioxygenase (phytanoyl-CoA dioxygenase family)
MPNLIETANELREQGFVVFRQAVSSNAIDAHWAAFGPRADWLDVENLGRFDSPGYSIRLEEHRRRRKEFFEADRTHLALALNPKLKTFAQAVFGAEPVLRSFGTHQRSLKTSLHADGLNSCAPDPIEQEFRVWCALEDIREDSGPVYFYPTSHRTVAGPTRDAMIEEYPDLLEVFRGRPEAWTRGTSWNHDLNAKLYERVRELGLPRVVPTLNKGDAVIFFLTTVHGTLKPENAEPTRKCAIFNFYGAGASFYEPRAYFGRYHDLRRPENALHFETERTEFGLRVVRYGETLDAQMKRPLVA